MLINPNRPDLEGNYISDDYTDDNGKAFRKIFLKDIHETGYSFVDYVYKKPESNEAPVPRQAVAAPDMQAPPPPAVDDLPF